MADNLGADLDQLFPQAGQRPRRRRFGHRQCAHEVTEIVGQCMELEAHRVGDEGPARQPRPLDRTLALLDPLLRCAALVVEGDNALGAPRQFGDDKADARVTEAGEVAGQLMRRPPNRAFKQVCDLALQDAVGRQPDCVTHVLGFEEVVDPGICKGRVSPEIDTLHRALVAGDHRLQH